MSVLSPISVFIVDDHQMLIDGIKSLLQDQTQLQLAGEATSGKLALEKMTSLKVDILIVDINMPEMNGIQLTQKVRTAFPACKILALSMNNEPGMISEMLKAGVSGYILKNTGREELVTALLTIAKGETYFGKEVAAQLMNALSKNTVSRVPLSEREKEIIGLIAKELSNAQIAETLFISERTVETHRKNIFRKTETKSVVGLIKYAYEHQLI